MQEKLTAGDSLYFATSVSGYSAAAGWLLKYRFVPRFSTPAQAPIEITATASGSDFVIAEAAATTADWQPGEYGWTNWVERSGEIYSVESGQLTVLPDPRTADQGADTRTQAEKALADARAALAAWDPTIKSYTIAGRTMQFNSPEDIQSQINYWQRAVSNEQAVAAGRATGPLGRMRFGVPN